MPKCKTKTLPSTHTSNRNGVGKRPFKGVRMRSWGSWVSEIRSPGHKTRIWLGSYSSAEAAARAYDAALLCLRRTEAIPGLNFPSSADMPSNVALSPDSMSPKSIQRVAAAAAHSTTPTSSSSANCLSTTLPSSVPVSPQSNLRVTSNAEQSTMPTSSSSANYPSTTSASSSIPPSPSMASSSGQASGESLLDYDVHSFQLSPKLLHDMSSMNFYPYMSSMNFYPWDEQDLGENGDLNLWSF